MNWMNWALLALPFVGVLCLTAAIRHYDKRRPLTRVPEERPWLVDREGAVMKPERKVVLRADPNHNDRR